MAQSSSPPSPSCPPPPSYTAAVIIGNSLHVLNLLNIAFYGWALYRYAVVHDHYHDHDDDDSASNYADGDHDNTNGTTGSSFWKQQQQSTINVSFDEEWLESGFCMPHDHHHDEHGIQDIHDHPFHFQTTHDLSGHLMISVSLVGLFLLHILRPSTKNDDPNKSNEGLRKAHTLAFWALIGAIGHGCGHYLISNARRNGYYPPSKDTFIDDLKRTGSLWMVACKALPGLPLFWVPLTKTYMINTTSKTSVGLTACIFWVGSMFMEVRFGFSYTQAVLFGGSSFDQLLLPRQEKDLFEFALWPLLTTIPNGLFAWYESTRCTSPSSPLMQRHGHLIYDGYMVSSYIVFYLICWLIRTRDRDITFANLDNTNYGLSANTNTRDADRQMMMRTKKLS